MNNVDTVKSYIQALESNDARRILGHFDENAEIVSPNYGRMEAGSFYTKLCADTEKVEITVRSVSEAGEGGLVFAHFDYYWKLKDGTEKNLEILDLFRMRGGKIAALRIFADGKK